MRVSSPPVFETSRLRSIAVSRERRDADGFQSRREPIIVCEIANHARRKALVVERLSDRTRAIAKPDLACPTCGARMRFVRCAPTVGAPATLVATCADCAGRDG